jgi:hypothetical protein
MSGSAGGGGRTCTSLRLSRSLAVEGSAPAWWAGPALAPSSLPPSAVLASARVKWGSMRTHTCRGTKNSTVSLNAQCNCQRLGLHAACHLQDVLQGEQKHCWLDHTSSLPCCSDPFACCCTLCEAASPIVGVTVPRAVRTATSATSPPAASPAGTDLARFEHKHGI